MYLKILIIINTDDMIDFVQPTLENLDHTDSHVPIASHNTARFFLFPNFW